MMPKMRGVELVQRLREIDNGALVLLITGFGTIESAVEAMRAGAFHYVTKPFRNEEILIQIKRALEQKRLEQEVQRLRTEVRAHHRFQNIIGQSVAMQKILETVAQVSDLPANILIEGESGTGKELIARAIHANSSRATGPFIAVNCAAIPETLLETELFGHEKGAFTGAAARKPGKFELAHRGTLFLDEIGDLPLSLQAKILRVLEEKRFERVGGTLPLQVDVRVVAATNRNLKAAVAARQYREDLFFRLSVFPIVIPPLRERPDDIATLARFFIDKFCRDLNKQPLGLTTAAEEELRHYPWPGNVRELQNCIERAAILTEGDTIHPRHLNLSFRAPASLAPVVDDGGPWAKIDLSGTLGEASRRVLAEVERRKIEQALKEAAGNRGRAAEILQVSYKTLVAKLREYSLEEPI
jgi:DNA-binding NtrC family response regulator